MTVSRTSNLTQGGGALATIRDSDPSGGSSPIINEGHHRLHEGFLFNVHTFFQDAPDATTHVLHVRVPTTVGSTVHFVPRFACTGSAGAYMTEGATFTTEPDDYGTALNEYRANRYVSISLGSGDASGVGVFYDPTVLAAGTIIDRWIVPGGGGPFSVGGGSDVREEWILDNTNKSYLFALVNQSGGAADMLISGSFYLGDLNV